MLQSHVVSALDRQQTEAVVVDHGGNGGIRLTVLAEDEFAAIVADNLHVEISFVVPKRERKRLRYFL